MFAVARGARASGNPGAKAYSGLLFRTSYLPVEYSYALVGGIVMATRIDHVSQSPHLGIET
jgi:hypothetical protein